MEGSQAYNASMQELVSNGYLSAIPKSKDASYVYYADATAQKAAFGTELKGQPSTAAASSKNYCSSVPAPYSSCVSTMSQGTGYVEAQPGPGVVIFREYTGEAAAFCRIYGAPSTAQCPQGGNGQFESACYGIAPIAYGDSGSRLGTENMQNTGSVYLAQFSGGGVGGLGGGFSGGGVGGLLPMNLCSVRAAVPYDITCTLSNTSIAPTCSGGSADDYCTCVE
jgi:hypothetical protein